MFRLVNMSYLLLDSEVIRLCSNRGSTPIIFALSSRKDLDDSSTYSTGLDEKSGHMLVITFSPTLLGTRYTQLHLFTMYQRPRQGSRQHHSRARDRHLKHHP